MKKYSLFFTLFIIAMTVLLSGCGDSFLNVEPRTHVSLKDRDVTYTPKDFVTGVYGGFTDWPYAFDWIGITSIISDNALKGSSPTDTGGDKNLLNNFAFTPSSISVTGLWKNGIKILAVQRMQFIILKIIRTQRKFRMLNA